VTWSIIDYYLLSGGCITVDPESSNVVLTGGRGSTEYTDVNFVVSWNRDYGDSARWTRCLLGDTGYCFAIEFAPANSDTVYAAGEVLREGAFYRSTDRGISWTRSAEAPREYVLGIAVHPEDSRTVYAAADDLFKSTDAGETWSPVQLPPGNDRLRAVRFHPRSADTIVAAGRDGVVISTDAGENWSGLNAGLETLDILTIEFAEGGDCLIAGTGGRSCFVWSFTTGIAAGVPPPRLESKLQVWPNPCRGTLIARFPAQPGPARARLCDVTGREALDVPVRPGSSILRMELPALPAGVYRLELDAAPSPLSVRFVHL